MALFMVRYGEIALKSPGVRRMFERALAQNLASRFEKGGKECRIGLERGRVFLWADDPAFASQALARTFGVVSYSVVHETTSKREDIFCKAVDLSKPLFRQGTRFRVTARRSGQHTFTSMELARDAGSAVFLANEHLAPKVDLTNPDVEIFIEVRHHRSYVYTGSSPGPGGMPLGTQGRVIGMVNQKRDIAACWLMMKRGCRVIVRTADPGLAEPLRPWAPGLRTVQAADADLPRLASRKRADGICVGWSAAEFDGDSVILKAGLPVFYPLMGLADGQVEALLNKIGA